MAKQVYVVEEKKDRSGWVIIWILAIVEACQRFIIIAVLFGLCLWICYRLYVRYKAYEARVEANYAAISARADRQYKLALIGDPLGTEGDFPCVTMPLTTGYSFDNYDDGLREWK